MSSFSGSDMPVFPSRASCRFVGEGSANVVFAVELPDDASPEEKELYSHNLLRVPKAGKDSVPCEEHHAFYAAVLRPLLGPENLVRQRLVRIRASGVHAHLNAVLAALDNGARREDWRGTRVADVDVAMLVEDMTATRERRSGSTSGHGHGQRHVTVHFKPKWLAPSPTAPAEARRCRNCARYAAATWESGRSGQLPPPTHARPCPLVLVSGRQSDGKQRRRRGKGKGKGINKTRVPVPGKAGRGEDVEGQGHDSDSEEEHSHRERLWAFFSRHVEPEDRPHLAAPHHRDAVLDWLQTTDLFHRLADVQRSHDPHGAAAFASISEGDHLERLQIAMTLRDCSCYVRIPLTPPSSSSSSSSSPATTKVEARLGDLDKKDGRRKLAYWQAVEAELAAGGFYAGAEVPRQETGCLLPLLLGGSSGEDDEEDEGEGDEGEE